MRPYLKHNSKLIGHIEDLINKIRADSRRQASLPIKDYKSIQLDVMSLLESVKHGNKIMDGFRQVASTQLDGMSADALPVSIVVTHASDALPADEVTGLVEKPGF